MDPIIGEDMQTIRKGVRKELGSGLDLGFRVQALSDFQLSYDLRVIGSEGLWVLGLKV